MSTAWLLLSVLFGSLGLGYAVYGRKQQHLVALLCGIVLMVLPYFIASPLWLAVLGAALAAVPFIVRL